MVPDALSRLRRKAPRELDIDTSLPNDNTNDTEKKGPGGPVLDGTSLQECAPSQEDEENNSARMPGDNFTADAEYDFVLDDVSLTAFRATKVDGQVEGNQAVLCALQLTPDLPNEEDTQQQEIR